MWQSPRVKLAAMIGLLLNIIGTSLAGSALWKGASHHADWSTLLPRIAAALEWFQAKVLRRTRSAIVYGTSAASSRSSAHAVVVTMVPAADASIETQMAYVREQVITLHKRAEEQGRAFAKEISGVRDAVTDARLAAQESVQKVQKDVSEIATGTVTQQMLGLFLVGLGTVVGAVPVVLGWT